MSKEIIINHQEITNSQTITQVMENKFKEKGLNLHVNEVEKLEDDNKKGVRVISVKGTKYFSVPEIPWHKNKSQSSLSKGNEKTKQKMPSFSALQRKGRRK